MTLNEYLGDLGSIATIAYIIGLILGKERNQRIFEVLTPFRKHPSLPMRSIGHDSAAFLDHTIFYLFRNSPISRRTIVLSVLVSIGVLFLTIAYCYITKIPSFSLENLIVARGYVESDLATTFVKPWLIDRPTDIVWTGAAILVLMISDYLSFLQTFLLLKMAKDTSSILQIMFVCWVDLAVTFFTSTFVIAGMIGILALKFFVADVQYVTLIMPSIVLDESKQQDAMKRFMEAAVAVGDLDASGFSGTFLPLTVTTAVVNPYRQFSDSEIVKLITKFKNKKIGGLLFDPGATSFLEANPQFYDQIKANLYTFQGLCRASPSFASFEGHEFYLSSAGAAMVPAIVSQRLNFPRIAQSFTNTTISNTALGPLVDGHVLVTEDGTIALVEHFKPWSLMTPSRIWEIVKASYSLGFIRFQEFQSTLPGISRTAVSLSQGTYCDFRTLSPVYSRANGKWIGVSGAETANHLQDLDLLFVAAGLAGESQPVPDGSGFYTLCSVNQDKATTVETHTSGTPKNPLLLGQEICKADDYLVLARAVAPELYPVPRLAAAHFAMLHSNKVVIFPLVVGSIGLTVIFYFGFICFLISRFLMHVVANITPKVAKFLDHDTFRDNSFCAIIFVPCFIMFSCYFLFNLF